MSNELLLYTPNPNESKKKTKNTHKKKRLLLDTPNPNNNKMNNGFLLDTPNPSYYPSLKILFCLHERVEVRLGLRKAWKQLLSRIVLLRSRHWFNSAMESEVNGHATQSLSMPDYAKVSIQDTAQSQWRLERDVDA